MSEEPPVPDEAWATVVRHAPIVSVDLVVRVDGGVLLGRRQNAPAEGEWFIPGGRVHKGEPLEDAVHRVAREELGVDVRIDRQLGVYEHHYDTSEVPGVDGKHYVPIGYVVDPETDAFEPDDQHAALRVFHPPFDDLDRHPHVAAYLRDAGIVETG